MSWFDVPSIHEDEMEFYAGLEEREKEDAEREARIDALDRAVGRSSDSWGLGGWVFE